MSLKQDVVIVNEYSVKLPNGKGSRGASPGQYVQHYMAREQATESLAPVQRLRTDDFIFRYMARADAVDHAITRHGAKREMRQAQGYGGVAFGYGQISLSDEQLKAASKDVQKYFDEGHTVLKTVLSFDEDYLRKHGIIDQDFECKNRGDYRGHIDQMKLRMAITQGLERMSSGNTGFDDLRYVGVIQVDTEHVHCHLAMVDAGVGKRSKDGTQRGKLLDRHKSRLRRGIDAWLDEKQTVAHLSSAVGYERRNVTTFIKRWAHERMQADALPQFLIACLPQDRSLWRAGSNDQRMRKANTLVTELVVEQLERPGSPMPEAMERITEYANERRAKEALNVDEWQKLIDQGRAQIIERAVNGVYQLVKSLPIDELNIRTPMLEVMGMDYEQIAQLAHNKQKAGVDDTDLISFGFRLRSYASRLDHHKKRADVYRDLMHQWSRADSAGVAADDSRSLYDFYRFEEEYQRKLMTKYQHFLPITVDPNSWYDQQQAVSEYGQKLLSLMSLRGDASLQRMKDSEQAERIGRDIYGQPGGRHLTEGKAGRVVLDHRIAQMRQSYEQQVEQLRYDLAGVGLVLEPVTTNSEDVDDIATLTIEQGAIYDFDEVKALDLHHLGLDFYSDVVVGIQAQNTFIAASYQRRRLLIDAMTYLEESGQSNAIRDLPVDDVALMTKLADDLRQSRDTEGKSILPSRFAALRAEQETKRRQATTTLDAGLAVQLQGSIDQAVADAAHLLEDDVKTSESSILDH